MSASSEQSTHATPISPKSNQLDINRAVDDGSLIVSAETPEHPEDRGHRQRIEWARLQAALRKDGVGYYVTLAVVLLFAAASAYLTFSPSSTSEDKARGWNGMIAVFTGLSGYYLGRRTKE